MNKFMKPISQIKEKANYLLSLPKEIFIEIRGREVLLAEGYCRIEEYTQTSVVLASDKEKFAVKGENLLLRHLSSQRIAIDGRIDGIEFL